MLPLNVSKERAAGRERRVAWAVYAVLLLAFLAYGITLVSIALGRRASGDVSTSIQVVEEKWQFPNIDVCYDDFGDVDYGGYENYNADAAARGEYTKVFPSTTWISTSVFRTSVCNTTSCKKEEKRTQHPSFTIFDTSREMGRTDVEPVYNTTTGLQTVCESGGEFLDEPLVLGGLSGCGPLLNVSSVGPEEHGLSTAGHMADYRVRHCYRIHYDDFKATLNGKLTTTLTMNDTQLMGSYYATANVVRLPGKVNTTTKIIPLNIENYLSISKHVRRKWDGTEVITYPISVQTMPGAGVYLPNYCPYTVGSDGDGNATYATECPNAAVIYIILTAEAESYELLRELDPLDPLAIVGQLGGVFSFIALIFGFLFVRADGRLDELRATNVLARCLDPSADVPDDAAPVEAAGAKL